LEFIKIVLIVIGACSILAWALQQGRKAIVRLIAEGGIFVSEISKAYRKAFHKIKNSK
jgi:hypothetical protein